MQRHILDLGALSHSLPHLRQAFAPGNPGGPGRPSGSRNAATVLLDQMADGHAEGILKQVLEKAAASEG